MTYWERCTSPALAELDRDIPVVLPMGAVEQHGPHLPLATDRMIAEHFAARVDEELGTDVLVLPSVAVGCSDHHRDFGGTLSVSHETFLRQVEDVAGCVLDQGFRHLLLLNAHGGNEGIGQVALERLGTRWPGRHIVRTAWWRIAADELTRLSESGPGGVGHACELETSLMQVIAPALVDLDAAPPMTNTPAFPWDTADMLRAAPATLYRRFSDISDTGVFGEPRIATRAKGEAVSRAVTGQLVALLRSMRSSAPGGTAAPAPSGAVRIGQTS
ncbi:creatininase family protein [Streptomyces luteolus]|uniref:Creatininase family protein n=1 Tax=Streptomyces luteolus TaxID=3043615 RepID=A0ABT6SV66_9ACTN|nr:creatininase family protein [Streptomyces sp. B-S-A12]MDI3418734.1 creatininase family protein [Streptomyces sp. B-S-A12]